MDALRSIALAESKTIHELCTQIAETRTGGSVTSSMRLFAATYFRDRCEAIVGPLFHSSSLGSEITTYRNLHLETDERDYVVRNQIELAEAHAEHPGLGFLLAYWRALGGGSAPLTSTFDLEPLRQVEFQNWVHIIDVSAPDPSEYRNVRQAPGTVIYKRPDNIPLRALGNSLYVQSLKTDYEAVKRMRLPTFQRLSVKSPEGSIRYHRLILPWARADGEIERLTVGVYPISPRARYGTSKP